MKYERTDQSIYYISAALLFTVIALRYELWIAGIPYIAIFALAVITIIPSILVYKGYIRWKNVIELTPTAFVLTDPLNRKKIINYKDIEKMELFMVIDPMHMHAPRLFIYEKSKKHSIHLISGYSNYTQLMRELEQKTDKEIKHVLSSPTLFWEK